MQITIKRPAIQDVDTTISELFLDGVFFCHILEDRDRGLYSTDTEQYIESVKVKHATAIPYGTYEVVVSYSTRFKKMLPLLLNVPAYKGIRIHPGNNKDHTSGCLLPGKKKDALSLVNSRLTFDKLFSIIKSKLKVEKVFITIEAQQQSSLTSRQ